MSATDRLEREITAWFGETAAPSTPDYTDDILRQTARSRQRPRWTFPERWLPMSVITFGRVTLKPVPWRTVGLLVVLALLLAVAAVVYVGGQRRVPAPFGAAANGLVAYSKDGDIFTVDSTTGDRHAIVSGVTADERPTYSLDGTRLAFLRTTGPGSVVVLADADGRNQVVVSMTPLINVSHLTWSPDGGSIAVTTDDNGETGSLWIVDTTDRTSRKIDVVTDYEEVQWRPPDGRQLMITARASGGLHFALVSAVDGRVEVLPRPAAVVGEALRPGGWSLDGRRFLYAAPEYEVHVLDMEGGPDLVIAPSLAQDGGGYPRFSNDGRRIVFMEWSTGDPSWLSVAPSDGSKAAIRVSDIYPVAIGTHYYWSPDDSTIVLAPSEGPLVLLDPAGGPASTPPWMTDEVESWQRLAP